MAVTDTGRSSGQAPESPFPDSRLYSSEAGAEENFLSEAFSLESPFSSVQERESGAGTEFAAFLSELHDEEFDQAVDRLVAEVAGVYQEQFETGSGDLSAAATRALTARFSPIVTQAEAFLDELSGGLDRRNTDAMSEREFEEFVESFEASRVPMDPELEHFLGKLVKKVKGFVKKGVAAVKKGVKAVGKGVAKIAKAALQKVLAKVKKLLKPLLDRVLKFAINKLPEQYRALATTLAEKLGGKKPEADQEPTQEPASDAADDTTQVQQEFDQKLTELMFASNEAEQDAALSQYITEVQTAVPADVLGNLDRARAQLVKELSELEEGQDPAPAFERFIPAILPALKLGLRLIGRPKVVKFLAKLLAKLLSKFVDPKMAPALSQAIVDAGLRLIGLEVTPVDEAEAAGSAVAATVEDTIREVSALPDHVLENEMLLEAFALEAFERAAGANMPPVLSEEAYEQRPDLREAAGTKGAWVSLPFRRPKRYKKFTRVMRAKITPRVAQEIESFCGRPLALYLRDRLGIPHGRTVEANVHLYEAMPGTLPSSICLHEKHVPGLANAARFATSVLHPLTPSAAALLFGEPGLGRRVPARYLDHRSLAAIGQRFYYLEVPGAQPQAVQHEGVFEARQPSEMNLTLDFTGDQLQASMFLSEAEAQSIAMKLRRGHQGQVVSALRASAEQALQHLLARPTAGHIRVVHGTLSPSLSRGAALRLLPQAVLESLISNTLSWLVSVFASQTPRLQREFTQAAESMADGVSLLIGFRNPPGFPLLRRALSGEPMSLYDLVLPGGVPEAEVRVAAGYARA